MVVDLPAPFGPMKPTSSPRSSEKLTPFSASTRPAAAEQALDRAPRPGVALGDAIGLRQLLDEDLGHDQSLQGKPSIVYDARAPINEWRRIGLRWTPLVANNRRHGK